MAQISEGFIGNREVLERLAQALNSGRASHAYLLFGPAGVGKRTAALRLAQLLVGGRPASDAVHPDLFVVRPKEGKAVGIDAARAVRHVLSRTPVFAPVKIVVVDGADVLTVEAANALLKVLEEPFGDARIFLLADAISRVLPTIRSRTVPVRFSLVPDSDIARGLQARGISRGVSDEAVALAGGRPGLALRYAADAVLRRKQMRRQADIEKLLGASRSERLAYVAKLAKEDPEALRELPSLWMPQLRRMLQGPLAGEATRLLRRLFRAWALLASTNVQTELVLEDALV